MASLVGQTVSHYRILEQIGEGGMGVVYKAEDTRLKRTVALKFLPHTLQIHEGERERFLQEAQAAAALNHPNICTIHDIASEGDQQYIVMEYVDGVTLRQMVPLEKTQSAINYAIQTGEALQEAHSKGIVHRDIKTDNIMVNSKNQVKVMDFGLAKLKGSLKLTRTSSTVGTLAYMAPEQIEAGQVDARVDIFSFGVVLFEMLTGHLPFRGEHEAAMMYSILNEEPTPLQTYLPGVSSELIHVISRALEKDPDDRYQSVQDMVIDLRRLKRETSRLSRPAGATRPSQEIIPPAGRAVEVPPPASPGRRKIFWIPVSVIAVVAALLVAYFLFFRHGAQIDSVAVLPLQNVNADPATEYLSDGITENIINSLSQLRELRVIPRSTAFRYKGKEIDPHEVGKELKVRSVLMGRLTQRSDSLNIQMELVDVERESQLWGEQYSARLSSLPAIQQGIVTKISSVLRREVSSEEMMHQARRSSANSEAMQSYLKGRYYWNKRSVEGLAASVRYFQEALDKDPSYALAYAGLADAYETLGEWHGLRPADAFPRARSAAMKALEIDDSLAEAHTCLASVLRNYDWNWQAAEREYRRALELKPDYPTGHQWYAEFLFLTGRTEEAFTEMRRARELDPLSLMINSAFAWMYNFTDKPNKAIEECGRVLGMDSSYVPALSYLRDAYWTKGEYEEVIAVSKKLIPLAGGSERDVDSMERAYRTGGVDGFLRWSLRPLAVFRPQYFPHSDSVWPYVQLGEKTKALDVLERSFEDREVYVTFLKAQAYLDPLRSEPRFIALMKKVGFAP